MPHCRLIRGRLLFFNETLATQCEIRAERDLTTRKDIYFVFVLDRILLRHMYMSLTSFSSSCTYRTIQSMNIGAPETLDARQRESRTSFSKLRIRTNFLTGFGKVTDMDRGQITES